MFKSAINAWNQFWFETEAASTLRLFKLCLGALLFLLYCIRMLDLELFFYPDGIMPLEAISEVLPMQYRFSLLSWITEPHWILALHLLLLCFLLMLALDVLPRVSAIAAFILHVSFMRRNMAQVFGVDLISTCFLFYLCMASSSFSRNPIHKMLHSMVIRLIQIQVCIIYAFSGLDKVRGVQWWAGEALWAVLSNPQLARFDLSWIAHFPLLIVVGTFSSLAWEVYFPALVWLPRLRLWILGFGVLMHVGIGFFINIPFFAALMMMSYISFLTPEESQAILIKMLSIRRVFPKKAAIANK